jgi:hypothetical protein
MKNHNVAIRAHHECHAHGRQDNLVWSSVQHAECVEENIVAQ